MKLAHIWRRKRGPTASHFVPALDRVREMRDHTAWESATPPGVIAQRAERVSAAREQVKIPPLGKASESHESADVSLRIWLREAFKPWVVVLVGFTIVLVVANFLPPRDVIPQSRGVEFSTIAYPLEDSLSSARLTDAQADRFARRALRSTGVDLSNWIVESVPRIGSNEGAILFRRTLYRSQIVLVTIKLDPDNKLILCTIEPK